MALFSQPKLALEEGWRPDPEDFLSDVSLFVCGICSEVCYELRTVCSEEHPFCAVCIQKYVDQAERRRIPKRCPGGCSQEFTVANKAGRFARMSYNQLKIKCSFCELEMKMENLQRHLQEECGSAPFQCQNCPYLGPKASFENHECRAKCPVLDCGAEILPSAFNDHLQENLLGHFTLMIKQMELKDKRIEELESKLTATEASFNRQLRAIRSERATLERRMDNIEFLGASNMTTTIHAASGGGDLARVRYLVEKEGTDANEKDYIDETPLHHASRGGSILVVRYLADAGANVNDRDRALCTPLHLAAVGSCPSHLEVVKFLCERGALVNAADGNGQTPMMLASAANRAEVVQYLQSVGGG